MRKFITAVSLAATLALTGTASAEAAVHSCGHVPYARYITASNTSCKQARELARHWDGSSQWLNGFRCRVATRVPGSEAREARSYVCVRKVGRTKVVRWRMSLA